MSGVGQAIKYHLRGALANHIFNPNLDADNSHSRAFAIEALRDAIISPPENLLPLLPVCDGSFACIVCDRDALSTTLNNGEAFEVVRWHLGLVDPTEQGTVLDLNPIDYLNSLSEELQNREVARGDINRAADHYYQAYLCNKERPRPKVLRPIQLACQNVIIGLASIRHDAVFDGLRVEAYASCEVAHLATGEADRAMAALILCDAFQSGGTMEVRFGSSATHECPIPPSLRRFARVRGIDIGIGELCSISPNEARELFLAVTPMSEELRLHAFDAFDAARISPERLCYALMAGIWSDIELTFLLGSTPRATKILEGGSDPVDRMARSAEAEVCRAAVMAGTFFNRLRNAGEGTRAITIEVEEDAHVETTWATLPELAAVAFDARAGRDIPWVPAGAESLLGEVRESFIVLPRPMPHRADAELLGKIQRDHPEAAVFLLVPENSDMSAFDGVPYLLCPQTLETLDQIIRKRLDTMRSARR